MIFVPKNFRFGFGEVDLEQVRAEIEPAIKRCATASSPEKCAASEVGYKLRQTFLAQGLPVPTNVDQIKNTINSCKSKNLGTNDCAQWFIKSAGLQALVPSGIPSGVTNAVKTCINSNSWRDCVEGAGSQVAKELVENYAKEQGIPTDLIYSAADCVKSQGVDACGQATAQVAAQVACMAATGGAGSQFCGVVAGPVGKAAWSTTKYLYRGIIHGGTPFIHDTQTLYRMATQSCYRGWCEDLWDAEINNRYLRNAMRKICRAVWDHSVQMVKDLGWSNDIVAKKMVREFFLQQKPVSSSASYLPLDELSILSIVLQTANNNAGYIGYRGRVRSTQVGIDNIQFICPGFETSWPCNPTGEQSQAKLNYFKGVADSDIIVPIQRALLIIYGNFGQDLGGWLALWAEKEAKAALEKARRQAAIDAQDQPQALMLGAQASTCPPGQMSLHLVDPPVCIPSVTPCAGNLETQQPAFYREKTRRCECPPTMVLKRWEERKQDISFTRYGCECPWFADETGRMVPTTWSPSYFQCQCPDGKALDKVRKRCLPPCPGEQSWDINQRKCACPSGKVLDDTSGKCVAPSLLKVPECPPWQKWDSAKRICSTPSCADNQEWFNPLNKCVPKSTCAGNYKMNHATGKCERYTPCANNEVWRDSLKVCTENCRTDQTWDDKKRCYQPACPSGQQWRDTVKKCMTIGAPSAVKPLPSAAQTQTAAKVQTQAAPKAAKYSVIAWIVAMAAIGGILALSMQKRINDAS